MAPLRRLTKRLLSVAKVRHAVNRAEPDAAERDRGHRCPRPRRRAQEAVGDVTDTAVRIMLAAADAFADRGFHATTTRDIASRAGPLPRRASTCTSPPRRCCCMS